MGGSCYSGWGIPIRQPSVRWGAAFAAVRRIGMTGKFPGMMWNTHGGV